MTLQSAPATRQVVLPLSEKLTVPADSLPFLWSQLDQPSQQQLAQLVARLIQRIRQQPNSQEEIDLEYSQDTKP